uniref:probable polygalacturonase At3g15720 n=1 Tax=Erigeron canadensis TaxID=72917 RepID=UPI001CB9CCC9|nr:probable polygalacturonase At3g15720 [Erigeron canadensis]
MLVAISRGDGGGGGAPVAISTEDEDFLKIVFLSLCYISFGLKNASSATYDVTSYGATGDGETNDYNAFVQAWADLCGDNTEDPTLIIPSDKTFMLSPVAFNGPCNSNAVYIKLLGNITAPKTLDGWTDCIKERFWIYFSSVQGLTIDGPGQIDGQGSIWWEKENETSKTCDRPTALHFTDCNGLQLNGTTHINSPKLHISIINSVNVDVGNLQIVAPGDSPNTDGIDISASSNINIHDSNIQTGDDCVAINGGIVNIKVTGVSCGPGHGISIGSLGEDGGHDTVEQVLVQNCNITGTKNGLRIKTVPKGTGYARGMIFQDIYLVDVENPILIDQHYCSNDLENSNCPAPPTAEAVQVYTNIHGSTATKQAITFSCSDKYNCTDIVTNQVSITGNDEFAYCKNAQGNFVDTTPNISCD